MVKRLSRETVEKFRERTATSEAGPIVEALVAALVADPPAAEADTPRDLPDRAADACEPLLAIADAAGGTWPARARRAASVLHASRDQDESLGLRLLADIRLVFDARGEGRIPTGDLIVALRADDEGPWGDERSPLSANRLARLLRPYDIASKQMRIGTLNCKGYERVAFLDSWARWLPAAPEEPQDGNTDHERRFDVSFTASARERQDLPGEESYPPLDWDALFGDDPGHDTWSEAEIGESARGLPR